VQLKDNIPALAGLDMKEVVGGAAVVHSEAVENIC
jgi:hypothetical protein